MLEAMRTGFWDIMHRGGPIMWPLLVLSVLALTLIGERLWFYLSTNHPGRLMRIDKLGRLLRTGKTTQAAKQIAGDSSVYGQLLQRLLDEPPGDAATAQALDHQQRRLERFMPTLSTIITAAPMIGILGTVLGIITAFDALATDAGTPDPRAVGQGIAEALITTAFGLCIAVATLLPYNAFRAQIARTLSRLEALAASVHSRPANTPAPSDATAADAPARNH